MDKYKLVGALGEGSFGRVYKAKVISNGSSVALKVISKKGRTAKELKGFRRECEIQRDLVHPNIILMLDSFETDNEIVVVTEFAPKELTTILHNEGFLAEPKVQLIVKDLVAALHYLHSNRILHRDLKPQNILLDSENRVKLCDFGFARNMSNGTHVLTSIKGTPLYMAPELIQELPYDYSADLWSLGCIVYELLLGVPPFHTTSILQLMRLIKYHKITWPNFLSPDCISFLKGLLERNPNNRLKWNQILEHPFLKGGILITETKAPMPLTDDLTVSAEKIKQQQKMAAIHKKESLKPRLSKGMEKLMDVKKVEISFGDSDVTLYRQEQDDIDTIKPGINKENTLNSSLNNYLIEDNHPIEPEEYIVFLQQTISELMNEEFSSLIQPNLANIIIAPLKNPNSNNKMLNYTIKLFSIIFALDGVSEEMLNDIKNVYLEIKLIPILIYAIKLQLRQQNFNAATANADDQYKNVDVLDTAEIETFELIFLLISHLIYLDDQFIKQFCDAVVFLNCYKLLNDFFNLVNSPSRMIVNLLSVMLLILQKKEELAHVVEKILYDFNAYNTRSTFIRLMKHANQTVRERICYLLLYSCKNPSTTAIRTLRNDNVLDALENLVRCESLESISIIAKDALTEMNDKIFVEHGRNSFTSDDC